MAMLAKTWFMEIKNRRSYCRPPRRMSLVEEAMQFGGPAPWASREGVWRRRGQEVLLGLILR